MCIEPKGDTACDGIKAVFPHPKLFHLEDQKGPEFLPSNYESNCLKLILIGKKMIGIKRERDFRIHSNIIFELDNSNYFYIGQKKKISRQYP